jgi:phytoene dehydrogenase-like protein
MSFNADMGGWALIYLGVLRRYGVAMFEGGTGSLPEALIACITEHGGRVRANVEVERLLVESGRVVGVRLRNGEEIRAARGVCTAFSPKKTLRDLLPKGVLPHSLQVRVDHIPTRSRGFADYKLNIALRGRLSTEKVAKLRGHDVDPKLSCNSYHTYAETIAAQKACIRGEVPDHVPGLVQITTAFDPAMAPPGCDTFWFWSGLIPNDPKVGWAQAREQITQTVISQTEHYYEGLETLEVARRPLTLPDIEDRFFALDGTVYHVDPLISRMGPAKPAAGFAGYSTPVPGLFLTGSGTHPVAGISGMPGQNAAARMLRVFKREDKHGKAKHAGQEAANWAALQAAASEPQPDPDPGGIKL